MPDDDLIPLEVRAAAVEARLAVYGVVLLPAAELPDGWSEEQAERARERVLEVVEYLEDEGRPVQVFESDDGGLTLYPASLN